MQVRLGQRVYTCRVARSPREQAIGLQNTPSLAPDAGMLFPFDPPRAATFHMGRVAYPIDILFIAPGGRVAKVVHGARPGTRERWSYPNCEAVLELAAGEAQAARTAQLHVPDPWSSYYELQYEDPSAAPDERFHDVQLPDESDPNADAMHPDQWSSIHMDRLREETDGPAQRMLQADAAEPPPTPEVADPAAFVSGIIEAMARLPRPLDWHRDALNARLAYAVVTPEDIAEWIGKLGWKHDAAAQHALDAAVSRHGMQVLGDGLVLAGLADIAHIALDDSNRDTLVLWRDFKELHNGP